MTAPQTTAQTTPTSPTVSPAVKASLVRVAWLAVALGIALEVVLLVIALAAGAFAGAKPVVVDLFQKISWSTITCVGLAFGALASKLNAPLTGLAGAIAAPAGVTVARAMHKFLGRALGLAGSSTAALVVFGLAVVKSVEYGLLGAALALLARRRPNTGAAGHAALGLGVGVVFGAATVALTVLGAAKPPALVALLSLGANELLAPIGCALVLYASGVLEKRLVAASPAAA